MSFVKHPYMKCVKNFSKHMKYIPKEIFGEIFVHHFFSSSSSTSFSLSSSSYPTTAQQRVAAVVV